MTRDALKTECANRQGALTGDKNMPETPFNHQPGRYPIRLQVGAEVLTVTVTEEHEAEYRAAAKRINDQYAALKGRNAAATPGQLLAIVALAGEVERERKS